MPIGLSSMITRRAYTNFIYTSRQAINISLPVRAYTLLYKLTGYHMIVSYYNIVIRL